MSKNKNKTFARLIYGFRKAFSLLPSKKDRIMVLWLWIAYLASYGITMIQPLLQMWIVDGAASLMTDDAQYYLLAISLVVMVFTMLLDFCIRKNMNVWSTNASSIVEDSITGELIKKSAKIEYKYFEEKKTYDKLVNISGNVPRKIADLLTWSTVPPIVGGFICLLYTIITLCVISPVVAILVAIGNILSIIFYGMRMKDNYYLKKSQIPQLRFADSYWNTITEKSTQKEVKSFSLLEYLCMRWRLYSKEVSKQNFKFSCKYSIRLFISDVCSIIFKGAALGYTLFLIINGNFLVGSFVLVYGSISVFSGYMSDISRAFINLGENGRYIDDWISYMDLTEEVENTSQMDYSNINIEFRDVSFKYPNSEKWALKHLNLNINTGEHIAIVGENGCGKSTFVALLMGLYDDYSGEILVNGVSLRGNTQSFRDKTACLFQDFNTYDFSIKENVKIGDVRGAISDENIIYALEKAGATDFVNDLAKGMDENIGVFGDKGQDLSGGQWQKIAIARTMIKKDASLVIMDEPTAALDPYSESVIYREFLKNYDNRTSILISHRLGATVMADRILVFNQGCVAEEGNHTQLMNLNGIYRAMYQAQSEWYQ